MRSAQHLPIMLINHLLIQTNYQLSTTKTDLVHPISHLHPSQLRQQVGPVGHGGAGDPLDLLQHRDGHDEYDTNLDWLDMSAKNNVSKNNCEKAT